MVSKRRAIGTRGVAAVVAIAIVIVGAIGLTLVWHPGKSITSSTTSTISESASTKIGIPFPSAWTVNSLTGLRLDLNLSTTSTGALKVAINEFNILDHVNSVRVADSWPNLYDGLFQWTQTVCDPSYLNLPAGYEVLQGNYGWDNFTSGTPLWLEAQISLSSCAVTLPPDNYTFMPHSDVASNINKTLSASGTWSGFWTGSNGDGFGKARGGDCPGSPPLNSPHACSLTLIRSLPELTLLWLPTNGVRSLFSISQSRAD